MTQPAKQEPSPRALRGMAKWHEDHAAAFAPGPMKSSHETQARELRQRADVIEQKLSQTGD